MDVEVVEETPPADDAPEVIDTSTTVVVPPADSGDTATLVSLAVAVGAHEERLNILEAAVQQVAVVAETAEAVAESAATTAVDAAIQAEEAVIEAESEPEPTNDEPPTETHWTQRSLAEWRSRRGGRK